jgi:hypothetical protein
VFSLEGVVVDFWICFGGAMVRLEIVISGCDSVAGPETISFKDMARTSYPQQVAVVERGPECIKMRRKPERTEGL